MRGIPPFRYVLALWLALITCVPAYAQRIQGVSIPVGSMDSSSRPLDDNVWTVATPPYPLDVDTGIGTLVNPMFLPSSDNFALHDHQYLEPHVPDPARAVITFRFDQPAVIKGVEVVQHTNGIAFVEGFAGDAIESLASVGAVFGPLGDVQGQDVFGEGERYVFDFNNGFAGRMFQLIVRKTSSGDGWAAYRIYPLDADGNRIPPAVLQGGVYSWGNNFNGESGVPSVPIVATPAAQLSIPDATAIGAGVFHSLAVRADGTVWGWGGNASGQLGPGAASGSATPFQIPGVTNAIAVAGAWHQSYAIRRDGSLWAWGSAFTGLGEYSSFAPPTLVPGISNVVTLAVGEFSSYAVRSDGTLWSWGFNANGALGTGSPDPWALSPVHVSTLPEVTEVAAHFAHVLALARDGTVWAWGYNDSGQIGDGSYTNREVPVQVPGLTDIVQVAAGAFNSYALSRDGTVWTWGAHGVGLTFPSPVPIGGLDDVMAIAAGGFHLLARRPDRSLWGWGNNFWGQLGLGTQDTFEWVAQRVAGVGQADLFAGGSIHSVATFPIDSAAPIITVPDTITVDATSPAGAIVDYVVNVADDLDPAPSLSCTPASGGLFPQLGPTTVSCTATDAAGHVASATFDVVVKDATWQLQDVAGVIRSWQLTSLGTSLMDKAIKAQSFVLHDKTKQACDTLQSFLNQVRAQNGTGLTIEQAADLIDRATRIRTVLGC